MFRNNIILLNRRQCFHTTYIFSGQAGKYLQKIMGVSKKKYILVIVSKDIIRKRNDFSSRKFYAPKESPILPSTAIFGKSSIESKITGNPRRINSLNKVFMRHITDIMATSEYSKDILGLGIEVNQVKVSSDYKFLRVYWIANQIDKYDDIELLLKKNAGHLRHELSSLRVIGEVPEIVFVKDKSYSIMMQVQERLNKADFGEDHEPPDLSDQLKSEFEILTSLEPNVMAKLEKLELENDPTCNSLDEMPPPMPQNVLGLNHEDILNRVKKKMSTSKAAHRSSDTKEWLRWSEFKSGQPINTDPITFATHQEQRKAFKAFLQQRQILKSKLNKIHKNWSADRDYLEEEMRERHLRNLQQDEEVEEADYILEDVEEKKIV